MTFRTRTRTPPYRTIFSIASLAIAVQTVGRLYAAFGGVPGAPDALVLAAAVVPMATIYFLVTSALVAAAIGLTGRESIWRVWNDNFLWGAPGYFVGAGAAAGVALIIPSSAYWMVPVVLIPLVLTYRAYQVYMGRIKKEMRHVEQMADLHLATVEALARAIDAKDQMSPDHLYRMQLYATSLARVLDRPEDEIQGLKTAAVLHDIGKLAVPEYILSKPGRLTEEEFDRIRGHANIGADIVEVVPFPYPVAPLIRSHHERWDGSGYPRGLKGEEIPLGARILAVVDYFDSLMSERPYHKPISADDAVAVLRREAGYALDPVLVQKFLALLPQLRKQDDKVEQACRWRPEVGASADVNAPINRPREEDTVFDDIASAHKEIYALYEIAQAMGKSLSVMETMGLISSKVTNLVPFSSCVLFLLDPARTSLRCRYASGVDAELFAPLALPVGTGTNGLVARDREPALNASPQSDVSAGGTDLGATTNLGSALVCPLSFEGELIGTLGVYHEKESFYTVEHLRLLERITAQAGAVIHNAIVFEQTQEDSLTDPLTGLPNRRSLAMHLTGELSRAKRLETQVSVLVIDLDDFKTINDRWGHEVGDRALCTVAQALLNEIRPYDSCVRYAGDEFVVVLSGVSGVELNNRQAQLRKSVETIPFEPETGVTHPLGISVGEATFPHDGDSYDKLFEMADARMYEDKAARKRVRTAVDAGSAPKPALRLHRGGKTVAPQGSWTVV